MYGGTGHNSVAESVELEIITIKRPYIMEELCKKKYDRKKVWSYITF
jgi:hypothetical protein